MNTVGIDVPSRKSTAAALRSLGEVVRRHPKFCVNLCEGVK